MKKNQLIFWIAVLFFTTVEAQDTIMQLWTNGVPGSIQNADYQEEVLDFGGIIKTSAPTLSVFAPPEGTANGTAIVICPGGGYGFVSLPNEGYSIAKWLKNIGITAFVLKYRLPSDKIMKDKSIGPLQDVQRAIRMVRRNADKWKIDVDKIGVIGFSAGGHLAASASTLYNYKVYEPKDTISARPDFSILVYPVITMDTTFTHRGSRENLLGINPDNELVKRFSCELQVDKNTPPAFLVQSEDDFIVPVKNSICYYEAMIKNGVRGELHIYQKGGHGYGLGKKSKTLSTWTKVCKDWMIMNGFVKLFR